MTQEIVNEGGRYLEKLGIGHEFLLRCEDCNKLVTHEALTKSGMCPHCGHRRVKNVVTLSFWEHLKIRLGLLRFLYSEEFLKEFKNGGTDDDK